MHHQLIHFPLVFLLTAFAAEVWWRIRGGERAAFIRDLAVYAGAIGSVLAVLSGILLTIGMHTYPPEVLYVHLGLSLTCAAAAATAALAVRYKVGLLVTVATCVAALLVAISGVWGGMLGHP
ncbi:MAG: hypothetical protein ACI9MC_003254 [Kiritimatiellia bacterium]|jgi:hypothetical protein